jgi:hypothetical protein
VKYILKLLLAPVRLAIWLLVHLFALVTYISSFALGIISTLLGILAVLVLLTTSIQNGIILLVLISGYLKDEWFMVSADVRYYLKHVALTVGLTVGTVLLWTGILFLCGFSFEYICECLPIVEMSVSHTPLFLLQLQPILGAVVLSVFPPVSICALFYCFGFAPVCYRKPWLAYLCVAVMPLIPAIVDILWRGDAPFVLTGYLVHLPIHLLACWSYQKTDNVWTPLISLAAVNLLASAIFFVIPFLLRMSFFVM